MMYKATAIDRSNMYIVKVIDIILCAVLYLIRFVSHRYKNPGNRPSVKRIFCSTHGQEFSFHLAVLVKACNTTRYVMMVIMLLVANNAVYADSIAEKQQNDCLTDQATIILQEVRPLVESAAGRTFARVPTIKLVTRIELANVLETDIMPQAQSLAPEMTMKQVNEFSHRMSKVIAHGMLGKYGFSTHTLYLVPENYNPVLQAAKIAPEKRLYVMKLVLAHELTHALQDQEVHVKQLISQTTTQEQLASLNAVIEGHAVLIQEKVGKLLRLDDEIIIDATRLIDGVSAQNDTLQAMMAKIQQQTLVDTYMAGHDFMLWYERHYGLDFLWHILSFPPHNTAMIFHPKRYMEINVPGPEYSKVLIGLESHLGKKKWVKICNMEIGEMGLRAAYANMTAESRELMLGSIKHCQSLLVSDDQSTGLITLFTLNKNGNIENIIVELCELMRKHISYFNDSTSCILCNSVRYEVINTKYVAAQRLCYSLKTYDGIQTYQIIWFSHQKSIVEISTSNIELLLNDIDNLIMDVIYRIDHTESSSNNK